MSKYFTYKTINTRGETPAKGTIGEEPRFLDLTMEDDGGDFNIFKGNTYETKRCKKNGLMIFLIISLQKNCMRFLFLNMVFLISPIV